MFLTIMLDATANELFTVDSTKTLAGCTLITLVICGAIQRMLNYNPIGLAYFIALGLSVSTVLLQDSYTGSDFFFAFINSFLIFTSAAGTIETIGNKAKPNPTKRKPGNIRATTSAIVNKPKRGFFTSWFD